MPTLIPYAKPSGTQCQQALPHLQLPKLSALLHLLTPGARQSCEPDSLTPIAETLRAKALGLPTLDGLVPWAALDAQQLGLPTAASGHGWAWLTPCHWQINSDHVRMADPAESHIGEAESRALMEAMRNFFAEDGVMLLGWHQGHWLAAGAVFAGLPTASLARASGSAVDHWMPRQDQARALRRLQNEMQMLLYNHPVNDVRAAARLLPINSFWVSGTGSLPTGYTPPAHGLGVLGNLQEAALRDNAAAWTQAWQALDAGPIASLLQDARADNVEELILCAENSAQSFSLQAQGLWSRMRHRFGSTDALAILQNL